MAKYLVIVESPAKAKTINKYLGSDYHVTSSVGHIRDLFHYDSKRDGKDEKLKSLSKNIKQMGIDPDNNWETKYVIIPGKEKVVSELKFQAKNCEHIFLATDLDREGEAIAWHLKETLGGNEDRFSRVTFNEITKDAIQKAFSQPGVIDYNLVDAQQVRRILDRLFGFKISPLLWERIGRGLSAGRVQSVAVKLIVEREDEINSHVPDEFWKIKANVSNQENKSFLLNYTLYNGNKLTEKDYQALSDTEMRENILNDLRKGKFIVDSVTTKPTTVRPRPPFVTSTLQQAASTRLGFGVKRTMSAAQKLYEAGYITYMRTDSVNLSKDALEMGRSYIGKQFGTKYLPEKPNYYTSKADAQEAHEAIRPSDVTVTKDDLKGMSNDEERLYDLIRKRFLACQMTPAVYDSTRIIAKNGDYGFEAKGRVIVFDGWTKVLEDTHKDEEEQTLPTVSKDEILNLIELKPEQHFTKPPSRYNEASLVKELEKRGIGRPSTYASIITTIVNRGYVSIKDKRFFAEDIGITVTNALNHSFPELMQYDNTAFIESKLDEIAKGGVLYKDTLDSFYETLTIRLTGALLPPEQGGMQGKKLNHSGISCEKCGRPMLIRHAKEGNNVFLGCSGYSDKENQCKHSVNLVPESALLDEDDFPTKERCSKCNKKMKIFYLDESTKVSICTDSINCGNSVVTKGVFNVNKIVEETIDCDKCSNPMKPMNGRFGRYMHCESCGNNRTINKDGSIAPPKKPVIDFPELKCQKKGSHFVLRETVDGNIFLSAHNFPKCREMRPITVKELIQYKDRLPEHLLYLIEGPVSSPDGKEDTIVRFSKTKMERYIAVPAYKGNKWVSFYQNGQWQMMYNPSNK